MKKVLFFVVSVLIISQVLTSCKARKPRCPAYGEIHIESAEQDKDINV